MTRSGASGIVLAGGTSRRMGRDKLALRVGDETLLARTARVVSEVADEVLIAGLPDGHPVPTGSRVIPDAIENAGPLAGMVAGLRAMRNDRTVVVACDLPRLTPAILQYLLAALGDADAVIPVADGRPQPTCAAYSRTALQAAERQLGSGCYALHALLAHLHVRWASENELRRVDPELVSFTNVNTPREWDALRL